MCLIIWLVVLQHLNARLFYTHTWTHTHTNTHRSQHSDNNYIPSSYLPSFLDLVIWGHEHECHTEPEYEANPHDDLHEHLDDMEDKGFYIYQPGSSVATSLCEGEVKKKWVLHVVTWLAYDSHVTNVFI